MQTNYSFLSRMKDSLDKVFSVKMGKYKDTIVTVAYTVATVLVVLSPSSMNNGGSSAVVRAQAVPGEGIEETEYAAIIQTNSENDFLTDVEGIQLLQMQTGNKDVQELVSRNENSENQEAANIQAPGSTLDLGIQVYEQLQIEKNENNIIIDKEAEENIAQYINISEAKELADIDEKAQAVAVQVAERKAAEEATAKAAAEQAAKEAAEKAAAEQAAKEAAEAEAAKAASSSVGNFNNNDIAILERIVEAEATGGDVKSKILVANVILNRVNNSVFPSSIEGVVFQKKQFSPISDGRYYSVSITDTTKEAVNRALQGEDYSEGALYFAARKSASASNMSWFDNNLTYVLAYGGHEFFR